MGICVKSNEVILVLNGTHNKINGVGRKEFIQMQPENEENTGIATVILIILAIIVSMIVWWIPILTDDAKMFLTACIITLTIGAYMGLHPKIMEHIDTFSSDFDLEDFVNWVGTVIAVILLAIVGYFIMKSMGIDIFNIPPIFKKP